MRGQKKKINMETQYELYQRLSNDNNYESRRLLFELKKSTMNEMCEKYNKNRSDVTEYSGFIESLIEFYLKAGFLTEKQLNAFMRWKTIHYSYGYDGRMSDLDVGFWGANDFGSQ